MEMHALSGSQYHLSLPLFETCLSLLCTVFPNSLAPDLAILYLCFSRRDAVLQLVSRY